MNNNCCDKYIESIFFQVDLFPSASQTMSYTLPKDGKLKGIKYYLDQSCDDNVSVYLEQIKRNGSEDDLLVYTVGGNNLIKGTLNNSLLELNTNIKLLRGDVIRIRAVSTSLLDCTIMAIFNIEFYEEV